MEEATTIPVEIPAPTPSPAPATPPADRRYSVFIGIVTYNNLETLKKCFQSWLDVPESFLAIWDNGSDEDTAAWLNAKREELKHRDNISFQLSLENHGLCHARNRLIEYCRDRHISDLILLADSDVKFHEDMVQMMQDRLHRYPKCGIVTFEQANKGFPTDADGFVEEVANECQLTRLAMWTEIGLFPESVQYYSGDSWKSVIANQHDWRTQVIKGPKGYDHFEHGSATTPGIPTQRDEDQRKWRETEGKMIRYWRQRLTLGKGEWCRIIPQRAQTDTDENVREERFDREVRGLEILTPGSTGHRFTNQRDVKALVWLSRKVAGNIMEIGCHEGITAMQFAINSPEKLIVGVDYSGDDHNMIGEQAQERPTVLEVGRHLKHFRNTMVINERFDRVILKELPDIDFVFYDAGLHYEGIKDATEQVLEYWVLHPKNRIRILAIHDYVPKKHPTDHPHWLRVGEYVRKELSHRYSVTYLANTDVAYLLFPPSEAEVKQQKEEAIA